MERVSLAELLEVRNAGLDSSEVLALLSGCCDVLTSPARNGQEQRPLLFFSPEHLFLTRDGRIEIQLAPLNQVQKQYVPPELLDSGQSTDEQQPLASSSDAHLVWCLGQCCSQSTHSDVTLFSLLNLMTVGHVQSRPSLAKVRQMVRNRLELVEVDRVPEVVAKLHREVMGDIDELLGDQFNDDIRFSSSRSSQMSIIPGPGAPEHNSARDMSAYQEMLASEVADRLRRDFSLSRRHSQQGGEASPKSTNPFDEEFDTGTVLIPDQIQQQQQQRETSGNRAKPIPSPRRVFSPRMAAREVEEEEEEEEEDEKTEEEGELTPKGSFPSVAEQWARPEGAAWSNRFGEEEAFVPITVIREESQQQRQQELSGTEKEWRIKEVLRGEHQEQQQQHFRRPNAESIEVEVHSPPAQPQQQQQSVADTPPKSARLYAKAAQTAKATRGRREQRMAEPEIEILTEERCRGGTIERREEANAADAQQQQQRPPNMVEESDGEVAAAVAPISGYSPGTRRKQATETNRAEEQQRQETESQQFRRQNSLQLARCSKRSSNSAKRRSHQQGIIAGNKSSYLPPVPEFLSNSTQPLIRLRAQSMKKKKMVSLHRSDPAVVFVRLLNGHSVEVNCKTDALVGAVFHTVAEHLDLSEHVFFGLALQQSEHIFLEEEQRLEKWAPPGWKGPGLRRSFGAGGIISRRQHHPSGGAEQYILHLRFRYYPKKREFIKTAATAHQLYLQLRQDVLSGALRFSPRERAFEMAALALCSEAGAPPAAETTRDYFKLDSYLSTKFYEVEPAETLEVQRHIAELHARMAQSFGRLEAEEQFIARCQMELLYGSHFYRVHKMKPRRSQSQQSRPFFADTRIMAVMPSGIGVCREERGGTQRTLNSLHEWHMIRTLQFDRKRFLLGTIENNIAVDHVFYTDHHSKASYLVRFAASQHRFMLKMRQWQGTLNRMRVVRGHRDVGVDERRASVARIGNDSAAAVVVAEQQHRKLSHPQMGVGQRYASTQQEGNIGQQGGRLIAEVTDKEYIQFCYGAEAQRVNVVLEKHPEHGLGLTLVDGAVNGVKGVYVKSVSADGEGKRKGLLIGDCLLSVGGASLFNRSRHDAVELVRQCGPEVRLELLRFPSISEVLTTQEPAPLSAVKQAQQQKEPAAEPPAPTPPPHKSSKENNNCASNSSRNTLPRLVPSERLKRISAAAAEEEAAHRKGSTTTTASNLSGTGTPQSHQSSSSAAAARRQRAVSDFGAISSHLPALRTDDILGMGSRAGANNGRRAADGQQMRYRRHKTSVGLMEVRSSESEEEEESGEEDSDAERAQGGRRGEYKPSLPPVSAMYSFLGNEDEEEEEEKVQHQKQQQRMPTRTSNGNGTVVAFRQSPFGNNGGATNNNGNNNGNGKSPFAAAVERFSRLDGAANAAADSLSWGSAKRSAKSFGAESKSQKGNTLDWTNELSDMDGDDSSSSSPSSPADHRRRQRFTVRLPLSSGGQLPLQIEAALGGRDFQIAQVDTSKVGSAVNLRVGDRILAVNGIAVRGLSKEKVLEMMRQGMAGGGEVHLAVERRSAAKQEAETEQLVLKVTLDKSQNGAIGLSLAKRMGYEGVFVRNIAVGSLAAREGTLRVGDMIWRIQGEPVATSESPDSVVKCLKEVSGQFTIEVKRKRD